MCIVCVGRAASYERLVSRAENQPSLGCNVLRVCMLATVQLLLELLVGLWRVAGYEP